MKVSGGVEFFFGPFTLIHQIKYMVDIFNAQTRGYIESIFYNNVFRIFIENWGFWKEVG